MIYPYQCDCGNEFDVIKRLSEIERVERCELCQRIATRTIALSNIAAMSAGDWNRQSFNPAFGKVVNSKAHQREILAKYKGEGKEFIEVGNEKPETVHKHFEKQREDTKKKRWESV